MHTTIDEAAEIVFDQTMQRLNDRLVGQIIDLIHQERYPHHIYMSTDIAGPYQDWRNAYYTYTRKFPKIGTPIDDDGFYCYIVGGITQRTDLPPNSIYIETGDGPPEYGPGAYRLLLTSDTK